MATVLMAPQASAQTTIKVFGRSYTCAIGSTVSVPDFDAAELSANGWLALCGTTGTTAQRPTSPAVGQLFNDSTLGAAVVWNGKSWIHHATGAVS